MHIYEGVFPTPHKTVTERLHGNTDDCSKTLKKFYVNGLGLADILLMAAILVCEER